MGKGRGGIVKQKKISMVSKEDTTALNTMFEQMTGITDASADVIIPKILKIKNNIIKYHKVFNILLNLTDLKEKLNEYNEWFEDIRIFLETLLNETDTDLKISYDHEDIIQILKLKEMSESELNKIYKSLKENKYLKEIIITCSNLAPFKKYIDDKNNIDGRFILREPGLTMRPLSFSKVDLKILWSMPEVGDKEKKFIMTILHHSYKIGWDIYGIISSPDVDIKEFSEILVESITKLRKQIPGCDKAFDVIENSVKTLEDNFGSYYKNSIEAENPSIIVESFIIDVSMSQNASPVVTSQFRKIVAFLKQQSAGINDPKIKKLFGMLNTQFNAMDKELGVKTSENDEL